MGRYIDADDVANAIYHHFPSVRTMADARGIIEEAPSIDIEPKRGEWICHEGRWIDFWNGVFFQDYYPTKYECNQCHHYVDVGSDKNFCPNCGADMREREGE